MKKRLLFVGLLLSFAFIPMCLNADYVGSVNTGKSYIERIKQGIKTVNAIMEGSYYLENGNLIFTDENFLSSTEFEITALGRPTFSYLFDGVRYWTLSKDGDSKHIVVSNENNEKVSNTASNISTKVALMVDTNSIVGGAGTLDSPWEFLEEFTVKVVSEDANKGTITPESKKVLSGGKVEFTIRNQKGYAVADTDCGTNAKVSEDNKTILIENVLKDMVCTVRFGSNKYAITLNGNGTPNVIYMKYSNGFYSDVNTTKLLRKLSVLPTKTGYTFQGYKYNTTQVINNTGAIVAENTFIDNNITLDPEFTPNTTKYTYGCSSEVTTCTYDRDCNIKGSICSKEGYTHTGWKDQTGKTYNPSENVKNNVSENDITINLTPVYTAKTYTVSFNANGGSVSTTSKSVTFDADYKDLPTPTMTGYTFAGWYTAKDGGSKVTATTKYTTVGNSTLYAHWTATNYTLTYNANGGSVTPGTKVVTYNSAYGTLATPTRTDYVFQGWYTAASGGTKIESTTTYKTAGNSTVYAHWTAYNLSYVLENQPKDTNGVLKNGVYIKYSNKVFVVYRNESDGYKAIYNGDNGYTAWLQTSCCNQGNCTYANDTITKGLISTNLTNFANTLTNRNTTLVNNSWQNGYYTTGGSFDSSKKVSSIVGLLNYSEYLVTKNYSYIYEGGRNKWIWTMTPTTAASSCSSTYSSCHAHNYAIYYNGSSFQVNNYQINNGNGSSGYSDTAIYVRPVIKFVKTITVKGGAGTASNPYTIGY